jgi:glyoxylase-like metal-dependent hydrolase (beta-lactamase superfamily II)
MAPTADLHPAGLNPAADHAAALTYVVVAVRYGTRECSRSEVFHEYLRYGEPDASMTMDYFFWLLIPAEGAPIVVDTGFAPEVGAERGRQLIIEPAEALVRLGVDPSEVRRVIVTHLHYDHIGNLSLFPRAEFLLARAELDFWTAPDLPATVAGLVVREEIEAVTTLMSAGRVVLVEDESELIPGVRMLRLGGHSPGQLALIVDTADGRCVLAGDAAHYFEELELNRPFALFTDLAEMYRGYATLRRLARDLDATLVAGHDPLVTHRFVPYGGSDFAFNVSGSHNNGGRRCE